ncbi:5-oxoprolinase subunit B family protein [Pseudooceanicola sp. C21-150M6]|uniref:5-oxoprolinase subunit B family protein n=1 Tax=Pseudooceanicola sp. C21-150M6 TaxID=3434355 RepID=UPI003D7F6AFE
MADGKAQVMLEQALGPGRADADGPQILPVGIDSLLVRLSLTVQPWTTGAVQLLSRNLRDRFGDRLVSVHPSLTSVLVKLADPAERERVAGETETVLAEVSWETATAPPATRIWEIPVAFGGDNGPDLTEAAALAGLSPDQAVDELLATSTRVLAVGFAPGQPYLGPLPERWNLPRMTELNPMVPRGALAVAVRQIVLFANKSPTGWRQVARCAFQVFQPQAETPAPLCAGDEVRLIRASDEEMDRLLNSGDVMGGARCLGAP